MPYTDDGWVSYTDDSAPAEAAAPAAGATPSGATPNYADQAEGSSGRPRVESWTWKDGSTHQFPPEGPWFDAGPNSWQNYAKSIGLQPGPDGLIPYEGNEQHASGFNEALKKAGVWDNPTSFAGGLGGFVKDIGTNFLLPAAALYGGVAGLGALAGGAAAGGAGAATGTFADSVAANAAADVFSPSFAAGDVLGNGAINAATGLTNAATGLTGAASSLGGAFDTLGTLGPTATTGATAGTGGTLAELANGATTTPSTLAPGATETGGFNMDYFTNGAPGNITQKLMELGIDPARAAQMAQMATGTGPASSVAQSALSRIISNNGTATTDDWLKTLGTVGSTALGMYNSSQQADAQKALADKADSYTAPSRARYESSFQPGFNIGTADPAFAALKDQTQTGLLARLSATGGNPYGNPSGLIEANKQIGASLDAPWLQNYRNQNAATSGIGAYSAAAPGASQAAINAQGGALTTLGAGLGDILNPSRSK